MPQIQPNKLPFFSHAKVFLPQKKDTLAEQVSLVAFHIFTAGIFLLFMATLDLTQFLWTKLANRNVEDLTSSFQKDKPYLAVEAQGLTLKNGIGFKRKYFPSRSGKEIYNSLVEETFSSFQAKKEEGQNFNGLEQQLNKDLPRNAEIIFFNGESLKEKLKTKEELKLSKDFAGTLLEIIRSSGVEEKEAQKIASTFQQNILTPFSQKVYLVLLPWKQALHKEMQLVPGKASYLWQATFTQEKQTKEGLIEPAKRTLTITSSSSLVDFHSLKNGQQSQDKEAKPVVTLEYKVYLDFDHPENCHETYNLVE